MEDRKKAEILARLSNLETEYQMRILLAVEYGSRAYGCASNESDYDIRLIYVYPMERYLGLSMPQDSISVIKDDLDICGWELRRALSHASKSNATFWEWMQARVIMDRLGFAQKIRDVAKPYFREKPLLHAQMKLIQSYRKEIMQGKKQAKNSLGLMRVAMQAVYIMQYHAVPPVEIKALISRTVLPGTQDAEECEKLLELCRNGQLDAEYTLSCELASGIDERVRLWLSGHPEQEERDLRTLDKFFRSVVLDRTE